MKKDLWAEGKYVDLWTVNHIICGFVVGVVIYLLNISLLWSFIISSVSFVLWEFLEFILRWEHLTNQFMDLAADYLGYAVFYLFYYHLHMPFNIKIVVLIVVVLVLLEVWGFSAYKVRKLNKQDSQ